MVLAIATLMVLAIAVALRLAFLLFARHDLAEPFHQEVKQRVGMNFAFLAAVIRGRLGHREYFRRFLATAHRHDGRGTARNIATLNFVRTLANSRRFAETGLALNVDVVLVDDDRRRSVGGNLDDVLGGLGTAVGIVLVGFGDGIGGDANRFIVTTRDGVDADHGVVVVGQAGRAMQALADTRFGIG